jgi:hypothetical protein
MLSLLFLSEKLSQYATDFVQLLATEQFFIVDLKRSHELLSVH